MESCWNVFGSVLYSCGDDGRIRMWKGLIFKLKQTTFIIKYSRYNKWSMEM